MTSEIRDNTSATKTPRGLFIDYLKNFITDEDGLTVPTFNIRRAVEKAAYFNLPYHDALNAILLIHPSFLKNSLVFDATDSFMHTEKFDADNFPNKDNQIELIKSIFINDYLAHLKPQSQISNHPNDIKLLLKNFNESYAYMKKMWLEEEYGFFTQDFSTRDKIQTFRVSLHTIGRGSAIITLSNIQNDFMERLSNAFHHGTYNKYNPRSSHYNYEDNVIAEKVFTRHYETDVNFMIEHCEDEMTTTMEDYVEIARLRTDIQMPEEVIYNSFTNFIHYVTSIANFRNVFPIELDTNSQKVENVKSKFFDLTRDVTTRTFGNSIKITETLTSLALLDTKILDNTPQLKKFLSPIRVKQMFDKEFQDETYAFLFEQAFDNLEDNSFNDKDTSESELLVNVLCHECDTYVKTAIIHSLYEEFGIPTSLGIRDFNLIAKTEMRHMTMTRFYQATPYTIINSKTTEFLNKQISFLCDRLVARVQEKVEIKLQDFEIDDTFLSEMAYMLTILHASTTELPIDGMIRPHDIVRRNELAKQNRNLVKVALKKRS